MSDASAPADEAAATPESTAEENAAATPPEPPAAAAKASKPSPAKQRTGSQSHGEELANAIPEAKEATAVGVGTGEKAPAPAVKQAGFADSNISNYGSAEHKALIKAAADMEVDFRGCGEKPGTWVWRVENSRKEFGINPWPVERYGEFFSGDSFIVLYCRRPKKSDPSQVLRRDIFSWQGKETSIDERGVCAYKSFELDEHFDGQPTQHRVLGGHETKLFIRAFEKTAHPVIKIMGGGIAGGFHHVTADSFEPRLLHCKGRGKFVRVVQVPCEATSLNHGDVFVLDMGLQLIQYNGRKAGAWEKRKGNEIVVSLRSSRERGGHKVLPPYVMDDDDHDGFWSVLGGKPEDVKSAEEGGSDKAAVTDMRKKGLKHNILYRVTDASGELEFRKEAEGDALTLEMLDTNDVFIVDAVTEIFVWVGKGANRHEKREAMMHAERHLAHDDGPCETTPVIRIYEGDPDPPNGFDRAFGVGQ